MTQQTTQKSSLIHLEQDTPYYIVAIMREGSGDDYMSVAWSGSEIGDSPAVIEGQYLSAELPYYDCNHNDIDDMIEIQQGLCPDCNINNILDECDIAFGFSIDCNQNDIPDECDISTGICQDCNHNGMIDTCDIALGTSPDMNHNSVLDECEFPRGEIYCAFWDGVCSPNLASAINQTESPQFTSRVRLTQFDFSDHPQNRYVVKIWGWLVPPETGSYTFWIGSGDMSGLWISPTSLPVEPTVATAICQGGGMTPHGTWNSSSAPVFLEKGALYYITAIMRKCDSPNSFLSVGWSGPNGSTTIITGDYLTVHPPFEDCNQNDYPDHYDIIYGSSYDRDENGIPDECEPDCNQNGIPDAYEISQGYIMDCNSNGIPDECDIANGISLDCNGNGIPDLCDISTGLCEDENNNGIPDECERLQGQIHLNFWNDIWKGTLEESIAWSNTHYPSSANRSDLCHYEDPSVAPLYILKVWGWLIPPATGEYTFWISSEDKSALWLSSDSNPIEPDIQTSICQDTMGSPPHAWFTRPSQQSNPIHLEKDIPYYFTAIGQKEHREYYLSIGWAGPTIGNIATGNVIVVDGRFISTDRPEQDCNGNGIFDNIDLSLCSSQDCNQNSIPDECDIAGETSRDCNGNGIPDECELSYVFNDCNGNEILDECDITQGTSQDLNGDGIPDECGRKIPGLLRREIWDWASYTENLVGSIQWIQTQPYTSCDQLESFDFSSRNTDYYIARLWGWLTPPASGDYTFWIASDNNSGLWIDTQLKSIFSTTAICTVVGRTEYQEWNSMPSQQKSKPIYLQQGVSYPVVAIMNEGKYGDYLSVAWAGPGIGNSPTIIQGQYLAAIIPYRDCNGNAVNDFDEIKQGICSDCNQNEYPDECDIFQGTSQDCNANGSPDECDIVSETSRDLNGDKIPDECQVDVRVEPVVVLVDPAGTSEVRTQLPESIAAVVRGGRYFVEIWASDVGVVNTGLTGMYVDVGFCGQTQATQLNNGGIFTEFASGTIQSGKVDEFGGSALPSGGGIGPEWVRVGWLTISADVDIPTCKIELQPSSSGIAALTRGLINWAYVQLGSRTIQILPPARSYDLDGDKTIGVGDLSLFAGSWQKLVPPATAGHDFDCDNFVGVGDLSWFATGWLKATNNPTILYPACTPPPSAGIPLPPSSWPGTIPSPPVMEDVLVGLALRDTASSKDTASNLPDSVGEIVPGGTYYLEVWSSDAGDINTGLTSVYVDLEFTEGAVTVANVSHGGIFTQFKGGTVGTAGIVNLGGSTLTQGVGGNPVWARLAVIMLTAKQHKISFMLKPSAWGVSAYGRGTIPWSKIAMGNLEYPSIGRWDINQNMRVEFDDFSIISENWLLSGANLSGDFDKSGWVTIEDLAEFVNHWLEE